MVTQTITLYQLYAAAHPQIHAVQGDTGRQLEMIIGDRTVASGATGSLKFERSDKTFYQVSAALSQVNNSFISDITQALTQPGVTKCQLKVTESSKIVSSYTFEILVEKNTTGEASSQDYYTIEQALEVAEDALETAEAAVDGALEYAQGVAAEVLETAQSAVTTAESAVDIAEGAAEEAQSAVATVNDIIDDLEDAADDLVVGTSRQLLSENYEADDSVYLYRRTPNTESDRKSIELVGGTVAWNQLIAVNGSSKTQNGITFTIDSTNNKMHVSGTATARAYSYIIDTNDPNIACNPNDVIFVRNIGTFPDGVGLGGSFYNGSTYVSGMPSNEKEVIAKVPYNATRFITGFADVTSTLVGVAIDFDYQCCATNLTKMLGTTIADYVYGLETATAGSGIAKLKEWGFFTKDYYAYDSGSLQSVKTSAHKTVGKNLCPNNGWVVGQYNPNDIFEGGALSRQTSPFIPIFPNTDYTMTIDLDNLKDLAWINYAYFDESYTWLGNRTTNGQSIFTGQKTVMFNISNANARYIRLTVRAYSDINKIISSIDMTTVEVQLEHGSQATAYEQYGHIYPLSNIDLRGILKLDANNKLYYDGDEYKSDGTVVRKYGSIDLGTLDWEMASDSVGQYFRTTGNISGIKPTATINIIANAICPKYPTTNSGNVYDKSIAVSSGSTASARIYIRDTSYSDAPTFKNSLNGVYLDYELVTPTTETATAYNDIQWCSKYGTEEFIDERDVSMPVYVKTKYYENLKVKLMDAPDYPSDDGDYIMRRASGQNSYVPFNTKPNKYDVAPVITDTASGAITTFPDGADGYPLKECVVDVNAVQDLHGYDAPWPAGGGKNRLVYPYNQSSTTINGVTFTSNPDGTVTANGTATASAVYTLKSTMDLADGTYILSGGIRDGVFVGLGYYDTDSATIETRVNAFVSESNPFTTHKGKVTYVQCIVSSGKTVNNEILKPMIRLASVLDATFAPYSNICPISGWSEAKVTRDGKNLLNDQATEIGTAWNGSSNTTRARLVFPCLPNTTYVLSMNGTNGLDDIFYKTTSVVPATDAGARPTFPQTIQTTENDRYIVIAFSKTSITQNDVNALKLQLELGSTATTYEPYTGTTYPITWQTEAGTVYGGELDVTRGKLRVTHQTMTMPATFDTQNGKFIKSISGIKQYSGSSATTYIVRSNIFKSAGVGYRDDCGDGEIIKVRDANNQIACYSSAFSNVSAFNAYINENPMQIVYELATPIEVDLIPTEITTLLGTNNLWSDTGDIEVEYCADTKLYLNKKIAEVQALVLQG